MTDIPSLRFEPKHADICNLRLRAISVELNAWSTALGIRRSRVRFLFGTKMCFFLRVHELVPLWLDKRPLYSPVNSEIVNSASLSTQRPLAIYLLGARSSLRVLYQQYFIYSLSVSLLFEQSVRMYPYHFRPISRT